MLLVRFALLDRAVTLEDVLSTLGGGGVPAARSQSPPAAMRPVQAESRAVEPRKASAAPPVRDVPAEPVVTSPAPPLRVTPPSGQQAVTAPGWKAGFDETANSATRERLTTEAVRQERLKMLRAQDPVLDAAVRELDLDLLD